MHSMDGAIRAFNDWMTGGGTETMLRWCLVLLVSRPLLTLVHELGHAAVGLARTEGFVQVQIGREPALLTRRLGRLILMLDPRQTLTKAAGYTRTTGGMTPGERAVYALAGPFASALASLAILVAGLHSSAGSLVLAGALGLAGSAYSLVPRRAGDFRSDGWHFLQALHGNGLARSDVEDTAVRAELVFAQAPRHLTDRRRRLLSGAPIALGFAADDSSPAVMTLRQVAFCGWCWREAQRDVASIREAALDALQRATATGVVEPDLTALAARNLAEVEADFGALFDTGLVELREGVPEAMQRCAFRYGGALREIERIRE